MPTIHPVERLPAQLEPEAGHHLHPGHAVYLSNVAERTVHAATVRHLARRETHVDFNYSVNPILTRPIGSNLPVSVKIQTSPFAQFIVVDIICQAMRYPTVLSDIPLLAAGVSIDATLYDHVAGIIIDDAGGPGPGVRWQMSDGTLPVAADSPAIDPARAGPLLGAVRSYPIITVGTGWEEDPVPAVFPTPPRPLIVPLANAGNLLRVDLTPTNVRILHVDVWERFDPQVEI